MSLLIKRCARCREQRPLDDFSKDLAQRDGKRSSCRECIAARCDNRKWNLWKLYRLTPERFDALLASQGGRCASCGCTDPGSAKNWHVDHDHACCPGKKSCGECICGILCAQCNVGIAMLGHDPAQIAAAAAYVKRTRGGGIHEIW